MVRFVVAAVNGPGFWLGLLALASPATRVAISGQSCATCHPHEVAGYSHSAMAHSLRRPAREPQGSFVHAVSGTKFTVYSDRTGLWQRMERDGDVSDYRVAWVIGSGNHASGYIVRIGDHLFQSPICFYTRLGRYDMAPGSEQTLNPDFIRPVTVECLLCHSDRPRPIEGTLNEYESPAFAQESISCDRCHGDPARHLRRPVPGSIVNPANLPLAARNGVCEQCHLKGLARILNPGKKFQDFHPGVPLEETFTIYTAAVPPDAPREEIKVISQSEELALSLCARKSGGRLWCGTCHDPHGPAQQPAKYYRARCLSCHAGRLAGSHPGGSKGDCVGCHMVKQNAKDGGHTAFTDHRISRRPRRQQPSSVPEAGDLVAWREPSPALRQRNLALAYYQAGIEIQSASKMLTGYQMLTAVVEKFPNDPAVLNALGHALLNAQQPLQAAHLFERVLTLGPDSAVTEADAGRAWMEAGEIGKAVTHLERAVQLDPLLLPAAEALMQAYRQQNETDKISALAERVREALGRSAPQEASSPER